MFGDFSLFLLLHAVKLCKLRKQAQKAGKNVSCPVHITNAKKQKHGSYLQRKPMLSQVWIPTRKCIHSCA